MLKVNEQIMDCDRLGIAVSGGMDSMALLHYCANRYDKSQLLVINIEHGIRGEISICDSKFVTRKCLEYGIECVSIQVKTLEYARKNALTIEQAGRLLRYKEFEDILDSRRVSLIALAHHLDDQVETILMRIFRGTGLYGLQGITEKRDRYVRPLLSSTKDDIIDYVCDNSIEYVSDESNNCDDYTRNYIRHKIIPIIKHKYSDCDIAIDRLAKLAMQDEDYIMASVPKSSLVNGIVKLPSATINEHFSISSRAIRLAINELGVSEDIELKHIGLIKGLTDLANGALIDLPHGIKAYKEYDYIVFGLQQKIKNETEISYNDENIELDGCHYQFEKYSGEGLQFDYDLIPKNAVIRYRKIGDIFTKFGGHTKSLGDYMTDIKIPLRLRDSIPVVAVNNIIYIVIGYEISDLIRVQGNTKNKYTIRINKNDFKG